MLKREERVDHGVAVRTQNNHISHFFGAAKKQSFEEGSPGMVVLSILSHKVHHLTKLLCTCIRILPTPLLLFLFLLFPYQALS